MKKFENFFKKLDDSFAADVASVEKSVLDYLDKQEPHVFSKEFKIVITFYSDGFRFGSTATTLMEGRCKTYCQKIVNEALKELLEDERISLVTAATCEWVLLFQPLI